MNQADLATAKALLSAMGQAEASKTVNDPRDFEAFLINNRLELDSSERRELQSLYR